MIKIYFHTDEFKFLLSLRDHPQTHRCQETVAHESEKGQKITERCLWEFAVPNCPSVWINILRCVCCIVLGEELFTTKWILGMLSISPPISKNSSNSVRWVFPSINAACGLFYRWTLQLIHYCCYSTHFGKMLLFKILMGESLNTTLKFTVSCVWAIHSRPVIIRKHVF